MKGFLILDMIVGLLLINLIALIAFSMVSQQKTIMRKAYEVDLSKRTVINILARKTVDAQIPERLNGFDIKSLGGNIDLESDQKIYVYRIGDDKN